jgi:hypothetical protein
MGERLGLMAILVLIAIILIGLIVPEWIMGRSTLNGGWAVLVAQSVYASSGLFAIAMQYRLIVISDTNTSKVLDHR